LKEAYTKLMNNFAHVQSELKSIVMEKDQLKELTGGSKIIKRLWFVLQLSHYASCELKSPPLRETK